MTEKVNARTYVHAMVLNPRPNVSILPNTGDRILYWVAVAIILIGVLTFIY